jgi:hypothetical protein
LGPELFEPEYRRLAFDEVHAIDLHDEINAAPRVDIELIGSRTIYHEGAVDAIGASFEGGSSRKRDVSAT